MTAEVVPLRTDSPVLDTDRYSLLTVKETAVELKKTEAQLRWMIHTGDAPLSAMIGGRRMFRLSDIRSFIDAAFDQAQAELDAALAEQAG